MSRAGLCGGGWRLPGAAWGFVELLEDDRRVVNDVEEAGEAVIDGGVDGAVPGGGGARPRRLTVALLGGGGHGGGAVMTTRTSNYCDK